MRDYVLNLLCLPRLIVLIDPQNAASIRAAEKLRMHHQKDVLLESLSHPDRLPNSAPAATKSSSRIGGNQRFVLL